MLGGGQRLLRQVRVAPAGVLEVRRVGPFLARRLPADAERRMIDEDPDAEVAERESLDVALAAERLLIPRLLDAEEAQERADVRCTEREDSRADHRDDRDEPT